MVLFPRQVFRASVLGLGAAAVLALAGCGNNYRPVVSAINPVGPSTQPTVFATVIAQPVGSATTNAIGTVVNVFGGTVTATVSLAAAPSYFTSDSAGQTYVLHAGTPLIDSFTSTTGLMTNAVKQSSLDASSCGSASNCPNQVTTNGTSGPVFIVEPAVSKVAVLGAGTTPPTYRQELNVPANPVYTIANPTATRAYTLSQGDTPGTSTGTATAIEAGSATYNSISASLPTGISPIYGVMSLDARRAFVMNKGGSGGATGTVTVINTVSNVIDKTINVGTSPVWADVDTNINELAVLNQSDGSSAGSLSIVNIPLCSNLALADNTTCDSTNPADAANFGQVLATVPVGVKPVQVAVLSSVHKAYVANSDGTVTVVDLTSMVATKTITVGGSLNWIQAVAGSPTGYVLVTASDKQTLTFIRTDTDSVDSTLDMQGYPIGVRVAQ